MRVIDVESHWTFAELDHAQRALPDAYADESLGLNDRGEIPDRLADIDAGRIAAMDRAGISLQILSLSPPGAQALTGSDAVALAAEANDRAAAAVHRHPDRLRSMISLPLAEPEAALAELSRSAGMPGQVAVMTYGRTRDRPLDDPAHGELLGAAARLKLPVFIHPQIPSRAIRDAAYGGMDALAGLGLSTFGWGWHIEAATAALRLIISGAFDRHPDLQIVLGHWGELLPFWVDRIDSLSHVVQLDRPVSDYVARNLHIATSAMHTTRLLETATAFVSPDRILFSSDYPFHQLEAPDVDRFLGEITTADRERVAHANAEALFGLGPLEP